MNRTAGHYLALFAVAVSFLFVLAVVVLTMD